MPYQQKHRGKGSTLQLCHAIEVTSPAGHKKSREVIRDSLCTSFAADADAFASHQASLVSFAIKA